MVEIHISSVNRAEIAGLEPQWLYIARPWLIFYIAGCLSASTLLSAFLNIAYVGPGCTVGCQKGGADFSFWVKADNKIKRLFKMGNLIDIIICVPFLVMLGFPGGRLICM